MLGFTITFCWVSQCWVLQSHSVASVLFCRECRPGRSTTSKAFAFVHTACYHKTLVIVVVIFQQDRIKLIINLVTQFGGEFNDGRYISVGREWMIG